MSNASLRCTNPQTEAQANARQYSPLDWTDKQNECAGVQEISLQADIMAKDFENSLNVNRAFLLENQIIIEQPVDAPEDELTLCVGSSELGFSEMSNVNSEAFRQNLNENADLREAITKCYAEQATIQKDETFSVFINRYTDWALSGCDTLQMLISERDTYSRIKFPDIMRVAKSDAHQEFRVLIATHRAIANISIDIDYENIDESIHRTVEFDTRKKGGQIRDGYQEIAIPLITSTTEGRLSMTIEYLAYEDDGTGIEPFLFMADPRVINTTAKESLLKAKLIYRDSSRVTSDTKWMSAPLPGYLVKADRIYLKRVKSKKCVYIGGEFEVSMRENLGHTMIFESSNTGVGVLSIDGEPAVRLSLGRDMVVRIPTRFLNGMRRHVSIKDESGSQIAFETVCALPNILTPADVLQRESGHSYPISVFPQTAHRYESLRKNIACASPQTDMKQLAHALSILEDGYENVKLKPLKFPKIEAPNVSIVIPAHNKVEVTYLALCSLLLAWNEATFEVIVVDDASTDETSKLEEFVDGIKVIHNEVAQRFIRACNAGAKQARGEYLVLLNNDVEVTTGWLDELLDAFSRFKDVGLAGSKLLYPDGTLQDAGGIIWGSGNPWNYGNRQNPLDPRFCYARRADYLSGAALMVPRHLWEEVGGLSREFEPMYFEDTDLSFKIREAGYTTWFIPSSVVYHYEGMTSGTDVSSGFKRYQEVNRPKFKRKWAKAYARFGEEGKRPDLEKDRGVSGRVLFIDYTTPRPDHDAGSYAAVQEMRLVQSLGFKVTFVATNLAHFGVYTENLQKMGIEVIYAPFTLSLSEYLMQNAHDFDAFYLTRYYVAQDTLTIIRQNAPKAKILFNNADLHFLREIRTAKAIGDADLLHKARETRDAELAIVRKVDVILSYSDVEHSVIDAYTDGAAKIVKCPWVVDLPEAVLPFEGRKGMSFLGSFKHHPNAEGITWFIREVMPAISNRLPDLDLSIYGSGMTSQIKSLASDVVIPQGFVENIGDAFDRHRIFVAPLLSGAGIKGKVLSALAHGIPCVLSPAAAEGIGLRHGHDCFIAKTPKDWADAIALLAQDDDLWCRFSQNARSYVQESYSFTAGRELMRQAFEAADMYPWIE